MLKAGIIGYGYMGEIRRRVIEAHPELSLEIICEPSSHKMIKNVDCPVVQDPELVLQSDCDLVFICTPNNVIPDLAARAMALGKHVFCEKPPGRNLEDIEKIRAAEKAHGGVKLMFGFNHRYHPAMLRAKQIIQSKRLGEVLWLRGLYGKSGGVNFRESWRNSREISGGGILLDQGIHMIDLFHYFCPDSEFLDVKATLDNSHWGFEVEDNAFVILRNQRKQMASLHSSATFWKHVFKLEFGLDDGYLAIEGFLSKSGSYGREILKIGRRQFENEAAAVGNPSEEIIYFDRDESWDIEVAKFIDAITSDSPVRESSSLDALKAMQVVERAYASSQYYQHKDDGCGILNHSIGSLASRHHTSDAP